STPHALRTASDAGPARALEADDRPTLSTREVVSRAVVVDDEAIVRRAAVAAVPGADVERCVLAEVLHPAVVPVRDRVREQPLKGAASTNPREVVLPDDERARGEVRVEIGRTALGEREGAGPYRVPELLLVALAEHRVEVGRDRGTEQMERGRPALLVRAVGAARQVVEVGLRDRKWRVELAEARDLGDLLV